MNEMIQTLIWVGIALPVIVMLHKYGRKHTKILTFFPFIVLALLFALIFL